LNATLARPQVSIPVNVGAVGTAEHSTVVFCGRELVHVGSVVSVTFIVTEA